MQLLAQASDFEMILEKFPPGDLIAFFAIGVVFSTALLIVITICITCMISSIRIASINARLAEKLAQQGMSPEEIERVIKTSSNRESACKMPRSWRRAEQVTAAPGKPPRFGSA